MPRKATSKAQYRWFKAVEAGDVKLPGLSPHKAAEMTEGQSQAGLPERSAAQSVRKRGKKKRRFKIGGK
jgi:hypothetical protein